MIFFLKKYVTYVTFKLSDMHEFPTCFRNDDVLDSPPGRPV